LNKALSGEKDISVLKKLFNGESDSYTKFKIAKRTIKLNKKAGAEMLLSILKLGDAPFIKQEVYEELKKTSDKNFGFDTMKTNAENKKAFKKIENWVNRL